MLTKVMRPAVVLPTAGAAATVGPTFLGALWGVLTWSLFFLVLVIVVLIIGVALLTWWIMRRQQARSFSGELVKRQERNLAGASPDKKTNLAPLTDEFLKNIDVLRKLKQKKGIPALYYLPWFMVFGAPASGKSFLLKGSGFRFCVNDTPLKEGGTLHCDWWFTNQAIFLDTAGRLTVHEGGAADRTEWEQLLKLLRRFRRKRPIDGMIVTVASNFLLEGTERDLRAYAQQVRERIDRATESLRVRCPVFVVVTKCDLIEGFKDFFDALPDSALTQILGWSNDTLVYEGSDQVEAAFDSIAERWMNLRPALLEEEKSREKRRLMFGFPEEFENLRDPFLTFLEAVFQEDVFSRPPALSGFYFTSGTQEGTTISRYFRRVGEQLGLGPEAMGRTFDEQIERRPYFVKDMFWRAVAPSVGLAVPVDTGKDARRRVILGVSSVTTAALFFLLSAISFGSNTSYLRAYPERLQTALEETTEFERGGETLRESVQHFGEAAAIVQELDAHPILSSWGLNKRGRLRPDARALYRDHFETKLWSKLMPVFRSGLEEERRPVPCPLRADLLLSYLGLIDSPPGALPNRKPVKRLLDLGFESDEADQDSFGRAWAIYRQQTGSQEPEVELTSAVRGLADVCEEEADPVGALKRLQDDCSSSLGPKCFPRLQTIASMSGESLASRRRDFEELGKALKGKDVDSEEVERIRRLLKGMKVAGGGGGGGGLISQLTAGTQQDGSGCVESYFTTMAPGMKELVTLAGKARANVEDHIKAGNLPLARVAEAKAKQDFDKIEAALGPTADQVNKACEDSGIRPSAVVQIARAYALGSASIAPGYAKADWTFKCDRLTSVNTELATKENLPPEIRQRDLAAVETEARSYSSQFERYWRDRLRKPKAPPGSAGRGISVRAAALKETVSEVRREVEGLECPLVATLEIGPANILSILNSMDQGGVDYGREAIKCSDAVQGVVRGGKRAELLEQTLHNEGPIAEFCRLIETVPEPLHETLREEIVRIWNSEVLNAFAGNQRTVWQQHTMGVSELTTRYPFKGTGESQASFTVVQPWLDSKEGKLIILASQMGVLSSERGEQLPCDLKVRARAGPQTAGFLRRAKGASDLIFQAPRDGKPVQALTLTFDDIRFSDPESERKYGVKMTGIDLVLAGERLSYDMGQKRPVTLSVPLPSAAPIASYVEVPVIGVGKKADVRKARLERMGEWGALALLRVAKREAVPGGDGVRLTWEVPYGSGPPFIHVTFVADGATKRLLDTDFELNPTDDPEK